MGVLLADNLTPACMTLQTLDRHLLTKISLKLVSQMQPLTFTAGKVVSIAEKTAGESAGGLFSGQSGPKPPPALSKAVIGMKPGGKRSVLVPPELAYGHEGYLEIPSDADIELRIELLNFGGTS